MILSAYETLVTNATVNPSWLITDERLIPYPYFDIHTKACSHAAAFVCRVVPAVADAASPDEHTVVVSYFLKSTGEVDYSVWCADKFIENRMEAAEAKERADQAASSVSMEGTSLNSKYLESLGVHGESAVCDFWSKWRKSKVLCAHTSHVLATLRETRPNFPDELKTTYETALTAPPSIVMGDTYSLAEMAFRVPVLIEGDRGAGKTFEARAFARSEGFAYVEANGHEGVEAPDLLGFLVPISGSEMVWKDGPLAKAFRSAQTKKTVLVIDEILRIRQRELSVLLTAFSPDNGFYRLPTGRVLRVVDGVGEEEVLEAPVCNLAVIATTNVGSEYAVDTLDPALAERFMPMRKDTEIGKLTQILTGIAKAKGFDTKVVKNLIEFFKKMTEFKRQGLISDTPTTRTLSRALDLATTQADVLRGLRSQILLWVARDTDGHPVQEQIADCDKILVRLFGETRPQP